MGLGLGLAVAYGDSALEGKFIGQAAEPDDGEFAGHFAAEGVDAGSEGVHGRRSPLGVYFQGVAGGPEGAKFLISLPFSPIFAHSGVLAGAPAGCWGLPSIFGVCLVFLVGRRIGGWQGRGVSGQSHGDP